MLGTDQPAEGDDTLKGVTEGTLYWDRTYVDDRKQLKAGGVYVGSQSEVTVRHCRDFIASGARGSWSHWVHNQEVEMNTTVHFAFS